MEKTKLHFIDQGPKETTPVVFIHAFPLNLNMWNPQIQALSANRRVIAYDIRGHGLSDVGDGQYTIDLFVDDLMSLLDQLKLEKVILCGLSMGGYIALRAMELHPEKFSALILSDTRSAADSDESKIKRAATLKSLKQKDVTAFANEFIKPVFASETFETNAVMVQAVKDMIVKNPPLGMGGALLALAARTDTTESLSAITIPTLILVGENDKITPPAASSAMKEKIPTAQMHVIPKAGHLSNLENPTEFNQRLISFLATVA